MENVHVRQKYCIECARKIKNEKERLRGKAETSKEKDRINAKLRKYGITHEQELALLKAQNFECKICAKEVTYKGKRSHIDHDHVSGKIRGILCSSCNRGLGYFFDNVNLLKKAVTYLKENNGTD